MSLYCFGKIVPFTAGQELADCVPDANAGRLHIRDLDSEDLAILCEFENLKRTGLTFRYTDMEGDSSATGLWLGASEVANRYSEEERGGFVADYSEAIKTTFLGGFIWNLLHCSVIKHGAVALVDGGVENIVQGTNEECWRHFLKIIPKPWDTHDNPLRIWSTH